MRQNISGFLFVHRRHSELRSESDRKVASLEARLEATIRKYEAQLHTLQTENERLKSDVTSAEHGANGKGTLSFISPFCRKLHFVFLVSEH